MTIADALAWIQALPVSAAVRGDSGWEWLFPIIEIVHVVALALVFGTILMVDLRLIGLSSRSSAVSRLSSEMLPLTWSAFLVAVISGSLLFMSKAQVYWMNTQFRWKFILMFLAGVNMLIFHFGIYRRVTDWDRALPPPTAARIAGGVSVLLWIGVIFFGRWIGFTT
jgi:hypothetical protein